MTRAPAWLACCPNRPLRPSWWRWPSLPSKQAGCAFHAVLALWFLRYPTTPQSTSCWPAPSWIRSFLVAFRQGAVLVRAFFGGHSGEALQGEADDQIIERARLQLSRVLGPLPQAIETVVRRWPQSLPQYAVGHLERMAEVQSLLSAMPGLHLVGSAYYGVGLPDLIREGRATARLLAGGELKTAGFTGAGWKNFSNNPA